MGEARINYRGEIAGYTRGAHLAMPPPVPPGVNLDVEHLVVGGEGGGDELLVVGVEGVGSDELLANVVLGSGEGGSVELLVVAGEGGGVKLLVVGVEGVGGDELLVVGGEGGGGELLGNFVLDSSFTCSLFRSA
jgi:hypothetical protein